MDKYIYTEEQVNQLLQIVNELEFTQSKTIVNAQRVVMILNILNNQQQEKQTDEELIEK